MAAKEKMAESPEDGPKSLSRLALEMEEDTLGKEQQYGMEK